MGAGALAASAGRRRGRRRRRGLLAEINVTPFVDVMLVLLIVFMITAPLLTVGVPVELPRTEARNLPADETPLTITIQADGTVFLQETLVEREALLPRLEALAQAGYEQRIFIRADQTLPSGQLLEVMAVLSKAGYANLGLVTEPLPPERGRR